MAAQELRFEARKGNDYESRGNVEGLIDGEVTLYSTVQQRAKVNLKVRLLKRFINIDKLCLSSLENLHTVISLHFYV